MKLIQVFAALMAMALLIGCEDSPIDLPLPRALSDGASGIYCGMILVEHPGPKAQIFEKGRADPVWFSSVRDALAYTRLPGEAQSVVALYVHDMGRAHSWESPQADGIWIAAQKAHFVVGSSKRGGMGMIEVVPFESKEDAKLFAGEYGGTVVTYENIESRFLFPEPGPNIALNDGD